MTPFERLNRAASATGHRGHGPSRQSLEDYYEGRSRLSALGVSLPPNVRLLEMVSPFPKLAIDVLAEVLVPDGFIMGTDSKTPGILRRWWQANDMDTQIDLAIVESLVQGQAYWVVGPGTGDIPRVTAHNATGVAVRYDHMGQVAEGVRRYVREGELHAVHFLPGRNDYYLRSRETREWIKTGEIVTGAQRPAIVPMRNRARLADHHGRSELLEILGMADASSRTLTGLQLAQELQAWPMRYLFSDDEEAGDRLGAWIGGVVTGPSGSSMGQLTGADLSQFQNTYKLYAQVVSSITGIPPSMLAVSTDNPASAEAMRVAKDRLISRAETKASMFGDSLEDVARLALEIGGVEVEAPETLEQRWRDPATASESARGALLLQAHAQGVISAETAREGLRLTPEQLARESAASNTTYTAQRQLGG